MWWKQILELEFLYFTYFFKINTTRSEINRNGGTEAMKGYTTEAGYNCFLHERNNKQRAASNY